jgi:hypothetical protein
MELSPEHLERLQQHEKAKAAAHEAGHAAVAAARGAHVRAWLERNKSGDPDEKAWFGHTAMVPRIAWRDGAPVLADDSALCDAIYGVSGMVAEELYDDPETEPTGIMDSWELGDITPSPSDLSVCPADWQERSKAVQDAVNLLRQHKALFDRIMSELLEHESLTDGQIADLAAELLPKPTDAAGKSRKPRRKKE